MPEIPRTGLLLISSFAFLAACGGGGGGGPMITPQPTLSDDSSLSGLSISGAELDQIFQSGVTDYSAHVSILTSTLQIAATTTDAAASITVDGVAVDSGADTVVSLDIGSNDISVVITAEDGATTTTYRIEVTRESAAELMQAAYLKASNPDVADRFGLPIAASGNTLAVMGLLEASAATGINGDESDNSAPTAGAVYIFVRDPSGVWSQQAYIKGSNTEAGDNFGAALSIDGDTLVVGAIGEDSGAAGIDGDESSNSLPGSGAAYIFVRDGNGTWTQQAYLKASNPDADDQFGGSAAVYGDTVVVGARYEDSSAMGIGGDESDNSATDAGAVYAFVRDSGGNWSQQAYIKASNTGAEDIFGWSISLHEETLAVGANFEDSAATGIDGDEFDDSSVDSGAAYVFERDGDTWSQQAYVKASNSEPGDNFGFHVSIHSDTLAVSAAFEDSGDTGIGGDQADNSAPDSGAAYVFARDMNNLWTQQAWLKASNAEAGDKFGVDIDLRGDALLVGAQEERSSATGVNGDQADNSAGASGAAYLFTRDAEAGWSQVAYLKAFNTGTGDLFASAVGLSETLIAAGALMEDSAATGIGGDQADNSLSDSGAVYVFE